MTEYSGSYNVFNQELIGGQLSTTYDASLPGWRAWFMTTGWRPISIPYKPSQNLTEPEALQAAIKDGFRLKPQI